MTSDRPPSNARMLTLVFTDLVNSTALKSELGDHTVSDLMARHRRHVIDLASKNGGRIIDWAGDGCFLTFETSSPAVLFALALQQAHHNESDLPAVRIGVHIGEVTETLQPDQAAPRIEGLSVDVAARIASLAVPTQVLMSSAVFNSVRQRLRGEDLGAPIVWLAHGAYELKGFDDPLEICEAGIESVSPLAPPAGSEKAHRAVTPTEEETLGWRPAVGLNVPRREHWILEDSIGEGGYGEVWLAIHEKTKAKRVFKFCYEPERVRGLKREVVLFRLLKESLGHREDIAQILDWEFERAPYFLESEYTEGGDLRDWSARHGGLDKIPLETRLEIVAQVAVALGAAHSVGVLHKDIKPANVLISEVAGKDKPRASLTDFGIGLITDPGALAAQGITAAGLTQTLVSSSSSDSGTGAGTRLYMAPEIVEGKSATTLSDIYSLGVVLYQMATADLTHAVAPGWERGIDDELLREDIGLCIDGDPERRLKSADELAERLRGLDDRREALRKRRAGARRRRMLVASTIVGPIVTLLILAFAFQQTRLAGEANRQREAAETASEQARESAAAAEAARIEAEAARIEAEQQRNEAIALRAEAERGQYVANTRLAATMLDAGNIPSAQAVLKNTPAAYRDWEWGYLVNRAWPPADKQLTGIPVAPPGATSADLWRTASSRLLTTLVGHEGQVQAVVFHPDGQRIVTNSKDGSVRIWDIESGKELLRFDVPPTTAPLSLAIDPTGRLLWMPNGERGLGIWDFETGEPLREFIGHTNTSGALRFSPDGRLAASGSMDRTYAVWDIATGERINTLTVPLAETTDLVYDAVFLPDSTRLIVTMPDNRIVEWDYRTGDVVRTVQGPRPEAFAAGRIKPDGGFVASWSTSLSSQVIWNTETGEEFASGSYGLSNFMNPTIWAPDGAVTFYRGNEVGYMIAVGESASSSKTIRVAASSGLYPGAFSPSGMLVAIPDADGPVRIYAPAELAASPEDTVQAHSDVAYTARFSYNGTLLATGGFDGTVRIMNADTLETVRHFQAHAGEITTLAFSLDDRYLYTFGYDDFTRLWDLRTGEKLFETKGNLPATFAGGVRGAAVRVSSNLLGGLGIAPDMTRVAHPSGPGEITVKKIPSGEVDFVARYDQEWSYKNEFSPDGNFLLNLPYQEKTLTLFDAHTGEIVGELSGHRAQIIDRRFSSDGSRILTSSVDGTVRTWDGRTGAALLTIEVGGGGAFSAGFSPDGALVAAVTPDGRGAIYNADTGEEIAKLSGHGGLVSGVNFSPDGLRLLTSCMDNVTRVWNLQGDILAELHLGEGELLYYTGWSPDGRSIVTTTSSGAVRVWRAVDWTRFTDPVAAEESFEDQLARARQ